MNERDAGYLYDIWKTGTRIQRFIATIDFDTFVRDELIHFAVIQQIGIMGEAAKCLSPKCRDQLHEVAWSKMARMRDMLVHQYRRVDLREVWNAATISVPETLTVLHPVIDQIKKELEADDA